MLQTIRFPYVRFESKVIERKDSAGHSVFDPVYYANITPAGGKDEVVKVAEEWLADLRHKGQTRGPFDQAAQEYEKWHEFFSKQFALFKAGEEMTFDGTPLRACPAFTKSETASAESIKIFTVEELSLANEESIQRMGMLGRPMKMKAAKYLEDKQSGNLAQENEALRLRITDLEEKVSEMLAAGIKEPAKIGRPRKE
jgi:hypothetical protein